MGVLNCQKCINNDSKISDEIVTGKSQLKNHNVVFSLDSRKTTFSPKINTDNFYHNKNNLLKNKDKNKRSFQSKKASNTEEDFITDFETIEIPYDETDSDEENENEICFKNNNDNKVNYNIRLRNAEYDGPKYFDLKNNVNANINCKRNNKFPNNLVINGKFNLNDFINKKIQEKTAKEFQEEINENRNIIADRPYFQSNYNAIIGNNGLNYNYQNNYINQNDIRLFNRKNYINQQIDEEKEEYEQENKIINISYINNNKYKPSTFSQYGIKNFDHILYNEISIKSEEVKIRKEFNNEKSKEYENDLNDSNINQSPEEKSAISYEIEYIDEINNNLEKGEVKEKENKIIDIENKANTDIHIYNEKCKLYFIENIEGKVNDNIDIIKDCHNQFIITDSFCDYIP